MHGQAITFDFHNTLAACPEWFELEIKTLPSAFLRWWVSQDGGKLAPEVYTDADDRYRQLRRDIIDHGNELTAEACLEAVFGAMRFNVSNDDVRTGVEHLMREALAGASPIPGAIETVREIHRSGTPIGVVSSAVYHPFLEWTLELFGLQEALRVVVTSASAGFYKSRPEIFLLAARALGSDPRRTVHVGDSLRFDVGGASRAGMGTVWLQHDGAQNEDGSLLPDLTLQTLEAAAPQILGVLRARQSVQDESRA